MSTSGGLKIGWNDSERSELRRLADRVAGIAAAPENEVIKRRWRAVNGLRRPDRAPVWCRPVGAWSELLPEESLVCRDPWLRSVERELRRILIKHEIGDDSPVADYFPVAAVFKVTPSDTWGVRIEHHRPSEAGGSWKFSPPLKDEADFERLRMPRYTYDSAATESRLAALDKLFGDRLPPRYVCHLPLSATLGTVAADLRGLTELMLDMAVRPDLAHRLMALMRDACLASLDDLEAAGRLTPNNDEAMTGSDPVGPEIPADGRFSLKNLWIMANSQEFDQVSPAMWREFCLEYQRPILERFGLSAYGCCENLTRKIDGVLSIPNLRIFVCSAWTDLDRVIERVERNYVIMWRQKASEVVFAPDTDRLRQDLESGLQRLKGAYYQIVLREIQTLAGHLDRLHLWTRLAIESAEKHA